jgi:heptosyltransferase-2
MKILVRATNWVGDAVMCIPALEAIRAHAPQAEIAILARPWVADIYRDQGYADRLLIFDSTGRHAGPFGVECLASELRAERFDCAVLLQNAFEAAWLAWRAGIPERIGYARDARGWLLTRAVALPRPGQTPAHEAYYYLELLRRAGWLGALPEVQHIALRVTPAALDQAEGVLQRSGARANALRLALAPGAAYGSAKCWSPDRFAQLADRLVSDFDADVIIFGAASERDVAERIATRMRKRPVMLVGQTKIGELPALFARCGLFVGNDSGAMHVAAAVGLPVVAVFGPTDPNGTAPVTSRRTLLQQRVSCSPCFLRHCPLDHRCMTRVEIEAVYAAARDWVAAGSAPRV